MKIMNLPQVKVFTFAFFWSLLIATCQAVSSSNDKWSPAKDAFLDNMKEYFDEDVVIAQRSIGGQNVAPRTAPYMAAMLLGQGSLATQICGGAVITPTHIVSAAHCIEYAKDGVRGLKKSLECRLGSMRWDEGRYRYRIEHGISHPKYDSKTLHNDIGLFVTKILIRYNLRIQPVALSAREIDGLFHARFTGWSSAGPHSDTMMKELRVNTTTSAVCQFAMDDALTKDKNIYGQNFEWSKKYHPNMTICAHFEPNTGFCDQADAGSPLILLEYEVGSLIGVASWNVDCTGTEPYVFSRISYYLEWLFSAMVR